MFDVKHLTKIDEQFNTFTLQNVIQAQNTVIIFKEDFVGLCPVLDSR